MRNTTIPLKRLNSTLHSPRTSLTLGLLFGILIVYILVYFGSKVNFRPGCASDSNFTRITKYKHLQVELSTGITQFLQLAEKVDESLSPYSEDIIHQLSNNIQKAIADLQDLQESTKPKIRRRPPLETWNSNPTLEKK